MDWTGILSDGIRAGLGINAAVYALAAVGLNVQFGYAGLWNFGQAGFLLVGAYGTAIAVHSWGFGLGWAVLVGVASIAATFYQSSPLQVLKNTRQTGRQKIGRTCENHHLHLVCRVKRSQYAPLLLGHSVLQQARPEIAHDRLSAPQQQHGQGLGKIAYSQARRLPVGFVRRQTSFFHI